MRHTRIISLLIAAVTMIALLLGVAAPAQAYTPDSSEPRCSANPDPKHFKLHDCTVQNLYRKVKAKIEYGMWNKDPAVRAGLTQYLVTDIIGSGITSFKKSDPARKPDMALLNQVLSDMSAAPSPATVACYGNVALNYIAKAKVNDQRIRNIYATVDLVDDLKAKYEKIHGKWKYIKGLKGRAITARDFYKAWGKDDVKEMQKIALKLIKDEGKAALKKAWNKWAGLNKIPLDKYSLYLAVIRASHAPVKRLSTNTAFRAQFAPLMLCETDTSTQAGLQPSSPPKADAHLETKNYTVTLTGKDLYDSIYDPTVPAEAGGCTVAGTVLNCVGYDRAYLDKLYRATSPLRMSPNVQLPAALLANVYNATVSAQGTLDVPSVEGEIDWQYGDYGTPARSAMTGGGLQILQSVPVDTSFDVTYGGGLRIPVEIKVPDYSKVSIASLKVTFTYQQMVA